MAEVESQPRHEKTRKTTSLRFLILNSKDQKQIAKN
jgi:hypothetical protein